MKEAKLHNTCTRKGNPRWWDGGNLAPRVSPALCQRLVSRRPTADKKLKGNMSVRSVKTKYFYDKNNACSAGYVDCEHAASRFSHQSVESVRALRGASCELRTALVLVSHAGSVKRRFELFGSRFESMSP